MTAAQSLILFIILSPVYGATSQYEIVPASESHFALEVYKTGLMAGKKHHFEFSSYHGTLQYNKEHAANSSLRLTIESGSVVCQDTWVKPKDRDKVQKYALDEILAVERYPDIVFQSTAIEPIDEGRFQVRGQLTIRDQTKPVVVEVRLEATDPQHLRFAGQANIKLTDYNLKPPTAALGAVGTKDEMTVLFQLTGRPAK
ncbi:MAG: YceI family protein [Acidobacteriaceae bacterium]|nr:YceI family protein [Acidobacteriaceae bacterium]MBV9223119.1 YceI family protein [Acidobacteriaceae bacterium]MBV9306302.1 YceI family protein [Acidobacteriaceae bacterium]MBV9675540.1 YceI family protein [Acidobacteriaceae bacterium]MBV9939734.1 YceI family protein [Acidobacteriaceae bacterium]